MALLGVKTELVPMATAGDRGVEAEVPGGGKGLFVAAIVNALLHGEVDMAVHSAKDLPSSDPPGVAVSAVPERAEPFDVLVTRGGVPLDGGVVGTSSIRRKAQLRRFRREIRVRDIRGNVDTRLAKLESGEVDGLVLAAAGLARLGISVPATPFPLDEMVPAPGQGALAIQVRSDDERTLEVVRRLDHDRSRAAFEAERALVAVLEADCSVPLGAYAEEREGGIRLLAVVVEPDGSRLISAQAEGAGPERVAQQVAEKLLQEGAREILGHVNQG
jgi:hydroxymethylbilane synthase